MKRGLALRVFNEKLLTDFEIRRNDDVKQVSKGGRLHPETDRTHCKNCEGTWKLLTRDVYFFEKQPTFTAKYSTDLVEKINQRTMMLQVDVEANDIRLTEPLTQGQAEESWRDGRRSQGYDNSKVIRHFSVGMMTLFILAAVVFFNRQSLVQCGEGNDGESLADATNATILGDTVNCNITAS